VSSISDEELEVRSRMRDIAQDPADTPRIEGPKKLHINLSGKVDAELREIARSVGSTKTNLVLEALGLLKLLYDEVRQ
jgi:hypothetical protein